jgi:Fe-S-cluster containining protein
MDAERALNEAGFAVQDVCAMDLSLSAVEKYLLRHGWTVSDTCDPKTDLIMTTATSPNLGSTLSYPKPSFSFLGRNRKEELDGILRLLSIMEGVSPETETLRIRMEMACSPTDHSCIRCGKCCTMRDAFQGVVSEEEVAYWRSRGLTGILNLVQRTERKGYTIHTAWRNPRTGEYFRRCPWIRKVPGQVLHSCAIHEHRPLKCRSFPLSRMHGEYSGCPGFQDPAQS